MKPILPTLITSLVLALSLTNCARYAKVSERRPKFQPTGNAAAALATIHDHLNQAMKLQRRDGTAALGEWIAAAETAAKQLDVTPGDRVIRDDYNFAIARIFSTLNASKLDPWSQPLVLPPEKGGYTLTRKPDARKEWNPGLYQLKPADQFDVNGIYVSERHTKEGIGAPLVAIAKDANTEAKTNFALPRIYYGVTAVARFSGKRCEIEFLDPLAVETVRLNQRTFPLAADFTVPVAVMLAETEPTKLDLRRLLNPEKYAETARIARLQPYDPNKTVVLVVHGLNSSPATWAPMINALRANEEVRKNYQFWFYSYPSGYPYPYSAAILRRELDAVQKRFPLKKKMVVIGHSMGGCISRLLVTDVGGQLWQDFFGKSPEETRMSPATKDLFKEALIFNHRPEIGRVIFVAAPLKGADMASGWMGRVGSKLVRSPLTLAEAGREALDVMTFQSGTLGLSRMPNSVDTLAPNNRFVMTINQFPISPAIPHHVIVGDRGKGGNKSKEKPIASDGLVPWWSSHLPTAKSELTVPSGHNAHQNPKAIEEVNRILLLHAGMSAN